MSRQKLAPFREGQRVEFEAEFVTSRQVTVPRGTTAVVDYVDDFLLSLTLEQPVPGLENYGNQVDFQRAELSAAQRILRVVSDP